ncbi:MAG: hypothetical protein KDJ22_13375 [Candidatus Competibacteraceae bacterium]|nr:hypothetical protein [Candidatus Competibacteraceae bacterium]
MANITKSYLIPSAAVVDLISAFGVEYQATLPDGSANPLTKTQFASAQFDAEIIHYVKNRVYQFKKQELLKSIDDTFLISVP